MSADLFDDPDNLIPYPALGRLLSVSARVTNCDHIGLLVGQRSRLADMGLAGQVALCADTVGDGLQNLADFFSLAQLRCDRQRDHLRRLYPPRILHRRTGDDRHRTPATWRDGGRIQHPAGPVRTRMAPGRGYGGRQRALQPAPVPEVLPCAVAIRQRRVRGRVRKSLAQPIRCPPSPRPTRRQVAGQVRARRAAVLDDFPTTIRHILRKQLVQGELSMEQVAARLAMHRRTLDRRLKQHGLVYSEVVESVKRDVACQLLRDTQLPMREIAASLAVQQRRKFLHRVPPLDWSDSQRVQARAPLGGCPARRPRCMTAAVRCTSSRGCR